MTTSRHKSPRALVNGSGSSSNGAGRRYWAGKQHMYPYQVTVKHFSAQDVCPRSFSRSVSRDFLRVPFDGEAHWGFRYLRDFQAFKRIAGIE